jgi:hypothetical protein
LGLLPCVVDEVADLGGEDEIVNDWRAAWQTSSSFWPRRETKGRNATVVSALVGKDVDERTSTGCMKYGKSACELYEQLD